MDRQIHQLDSILSLLLTYVVPAQKPDGSEEAKRFSLNDLKILLGIDALVGGLKLQGDWDANTNTPAIPAAAAGNKGWYYFVITGAGTPEAPVAIPNLPVTDWAPGDWVFSTGSAWRKVDNSQRAVSADGVIGLAAFVEALIDANSIWFNTTDYLDGDGLSAPTAYTIKPGSLIESLLAPAVVAKLNAIGGGGSSDWVPIQSGTKARSAGALVLDATVDLDDYHTIIVYMKGLQFDEANAKLRMRMSEDNITYAGDDATNQYTHRSAPEGAVAIEPQIQLLHGFTANGNDPDAGQNDPDSAGDLTITISNADTNTLRTKVEYRGSMRVWFGADFIFYNGTAERNAKAVDRFFKIFATGDGGAIQWSCRKFKMFGIK